jgi:hypothetical protein
MSHADKFPLKGEDFCLKVGGFWKTLENILNQYKVI